MVNYMFHWSAKTAQDNFFENLQVTTRNSTSLATPNDKMGTLNY